MSKMNSASTLNRVLESPAWAIAKTISIITSPAVLGFVSVYLMGVEVNSPDFWPWAIAYATYGVALPIVYLLYLMHKGEISDFHMRDRAERIKPMKAILLIFSSASLIFYFLDAPYVLQVFTYVGALQAIVMLLITMRWKISGHGAGAAAFSLLLVGLYGPTAAPAFLLIPVVIWARVYTDRHDLRQTIVGAIAGFAFMYLALAWVASHCPGVGLACI